MVDHLPSIPKNEVSFSLERKFYRSSTEESQTNQHSDFGTSRSHMRSYKDTTFGTTKRMYLPPSNKYDFLDPQSTLESKLGSFPKSERKIHLTNYGLDSPNACKYDVLESENSMRTKKGSYSFKKNINNAALMDPETILTKVNSITPGPGVYDVSNTGLAKDGPKYTIFKQKSGYSYLPYGIMSNPPATKYDPKPTYLKREFSQRDKGILKAEREYSYINYSKTPGPGEYSTRTNAYLPSSSTNGVIDRAAKQSCITPDISVGIPGPGSYDLRIQLSSKREWDVNRNKAAQYRELRRPRNIFKSGPY